MSGRLSKSISVLYIEKEREEELEKILENIRRRFIAISFGLQSGMFTLEELIRSYIAISYLAEIYRYWTIDRRKPDEIYDSVFSTEHGVKPVKEMLREEFLKPMGLTQRELAEAIQVSYQRVNELVNGKRGMTPGTALRLARFFGTTPDFWMNLQVRWDLYWEQKREGRLLEEILPYAKVTGG